MISLSAVTVITPRGVEVEVIGPAVWVTDPLDVMVKLPSALEVPKFMEPPAIRALLPVPPATSLTVPPKLFPVSESEILPRVAVTEVVLLLPME